jgi:hypothetical protein
VPSDSPTNVIAMKSLIPNKSVSPKENSPPRKDAEGVKAFPTHTSDRSPPSSSPSGIHTLKVPATSLLARRRSGSAVTPGNKKAFELARSRFADAIAESRSDGL